MILEHALHGLGRRFGEFAHHRDEQVLFVLEIDVDGALGDAGALGDLIERRRRVAVTGKLGEGGFDDFLRTLRLAAAPCLGASLQDVRHWAT